MSVINLLSITTKELPIIKIIYVVKLFLEITLIIVPIILVIISSIDLIKTIISNNDSENKKIINKLLKRVVSMIIIFFLLPIINITLSLMSTTSINETQYWSNANKEAIKKLEELKKKEDLIKNIAYNKIDMQKKLDYLQKEYEEMLNNVTKVVELTNNKDNLNSDKENMQILIVGGIEKEEIIELDSKVSELDNIKYKADLFTLIESLQNKINVSSSKNLKNKLNKLNDTKEEIEKKCTEDNVDLYSLELKSFINDLQYILTNEYINRITSEINKVKNKTVDTEQKYNKEVSDAIARAKAINDPIPSNLPINESSSTRDKMVAFALQYVGGKYVYGGTSLSTGIDCSAFMMRIHESVGISIPRTTFAQLPKGKVVSLSNLRKGDLVFYNVKSPTSHVSMYIGDGKIVHAKGEKYGIVIDKLNYSKPNAAITFLND